MQERLLINLHRGLFTHQKTVECHSLLETVVVYFIEGDIFYCKQMGEILRELCNEFAMNGDFLEVVKHVGNSNDCEYLDEVVQENWFKKELAVFTRYLQNKCSRELGERVDPYRVIAFGLKCCVKVLRANGKGYTIVDIGTNSEISVNILDVQGELYILYPNVRMYNRINYDSLIENRPKTLVVAETSWTIKSTLLTTLSLLFQYTKIQLNS